MQLSLDLKWLYLLHISWKLDESEKGFYDNLDQQDKVLTSAGINWQTFLNLFTLNIVSILLLTVKLLKLKIVVEFLCLLEVTKSIIPAYVIVTCQKGMLWGF